MKDITKMNQQELGSLELSIKHELIERIYQERLDEEINKRNTDSTGKFICPLCNGCHTQKAGLTPPKKQRYKCLDYKKHMIGSRDSLTFSSKKGFEHWVLFVESLLNGDVLKVSANKVGISVATAFRWRHKVFYIMNIKMNQTALTDEVYLDETVFPNIAKDRTTVKENIPKKRGMSDQKINVTCAIDSSGNAVIKVTDTGRVRAQSLIDIYDNLIQEKSIVVSDSHRSYHKLMEYLGEIE